MFCMNRFVSENNALTAINSRKKITANTPIFSGIEERNFPH